MVEVTSEEREIPRKGKVEKLSSGIQDLRLFRDGQLVGYAPNQPGDITVDPRSHTAQLTFGNIQLPSGKDSVTFSAYAFNVDGVKSGTHKLTYALPKAIPSRKGKAYIIAIGVSEYENPDWNLQFSANDAESVKHTLDSRLKDLTQYESVVPIVLNNKDATKEHIKAVLQALAGKTPSKVTEDIAIPQLAQIQQATPDDMLIIAYSGHGYSEHGSGIFYLFPHDIGPGRGRGTPSNAILQRSISTDELSQWLRDVDAGEMVMIVDACNSSASVEGDVDHKFKPGPMGSRGFGQLAYDKSMRVLAASQAEEVAREFPQLHQSLLTYVLTQEGLDKGQADFKPEDQEIRMGEWLEYGLDRAPKLNEQLREDKLPGNLVEKGFHVIRNNTALQTQLREIQQPGLFDFSRGKRNSLISQLNGGNENNASR